MTGRMKIQLCGMVLAAAAALGVCHADAQAHVIDIVADKDSRYKTLDGSKPKITLKAGEQVLLRVSARKGKSWNRDGSIHGFTLLVTGPRWKAGICCCGRASRSSN